MAMVYLPLPSVVSFIQIASSAVIVLLIKSCGINVDDLDSDKLKAYAFYIVAFVTCIFANMKALENSNVETVIVFRACSPLAVTLIEYFFMDRSWPSLRSSASLLIVGVGAVIYCMADSQIALEGWGAYGWVFAYFFLITFEMTYGKKLTSSVKMDSVWGPVLYCNLLSIVPMGALGIVSGDFDNISDHLSKMESIGWILLIFSCIVGTLIGYTGWLCRGMVSATTYTLVGVVNKFITVLLNVMIWDKHSSPVGLIAVCLCLLAGSFYQQAPKREVVNKDKDVEPLMNKPSDKNSA